MKKIILLLLIIPLFISCSSKKKNDLQSEGIYGKVKFITHTSYYHSLQKFGEISKNDKKVYKYDTKGNKIEDALYDSDGKIEGKIVYKYNTKGNKIEDALYDSDGKLKYKSVYKYEYDEEGNWITKTTYIKTKPHSIEGREITYYK